jgi:hypothetical protein
MSETQPKPEAWHIKREVQLSHLAATLSVVFSVIWYAGKLEQRIALIEQAILVQRDRDASQDAASNAAYDQTTRQLDCIDAKLDRLIEAKGLRP